MNKIDRLLQMMEQPQQYTADEWQEILTDDECRELYTLMSKTQSAIDAARADEEVTDEMIAAEWVRFERQHYSNNYSAFFKFAAMFVAVLMLTLGTVWAFTGISEGKIVMTEQTGTLAANTPYIFQATNDASDVVFSNVTIVNSDDPKIVNNEVGFTFRGTYTQKTWEADDAAVTGGHLYGFMMQDNDGQVEGQFVKARRKTILRPFSCYLEYNGDLSDTNPSSHAAARSATRGTAGETPDVIDIVWVSANGTVTGISRLDTRTGEITDSDDWYLMDGRKLNGEPTVKGLYINNGKVVIIK